MSTDLFAGALASEADLRALYEEPKASSVGKQITGLDAGARALIAATPFVLVASHGPDGRCDVTPRGGPPGFVTVLDDGHVAIPDATGNRRLDTLRNVVVSGQAGLLFVIPGRTQTLRVNGRACVSADAALLARLSPVGKPPRSAIVVAAEEVYTHCPKAFVRSSLWEPATWPSSDALPTPAEVSAAHLAQSDPAVTVEEIERSQRESLLYRLE